MPKRRNRRHQNGTAVYQLLPDGPADILRVPATEADGSVIRPAMVEPADWKDPTDTVSHRARQHGARDVHGWRRVWTIASLHASCPREITAAHVRAADRLLSDYERAYVGAHGAGTMDYIDGGTNSGVPDSSLEAMARYRAACGAVGTYSAMVLNHVVLGNWTITRLAASLDIHRDRAHGRLHSALERLREHYWPKDAESGSAASSATLEPESDNRTGRWR
jgi:hypothetical protein